MKNKELTKVKGMLETRKDGLEAKRKSASLTDDQKAKLDATLAEVNAAIVSLDEADEQATVDQIISIFTMAVEQLSKSTDEAVADAKNEMQANITKLQAQIEKTGKSKKFSAKLDFVRMREAKSGIDGYKPYSAGVDVSAWTPEAEIDTAETFRPVIGVVQGFEKSTTSKEAIKVRGLKVGSGGATVVLNHAAKPVIETIGSQNVVNVSTYAGVVEGIADEDLEDNAGLEGEIATEALENLAEVENTAAITLLNSVGKAYSNSTFGTKAYADEKTALAAIIDQVHQAKGRRNSQIALAMNSSQWALLKDLRNSNGTPIDVQSVIGDVIQITDNSLTTDSFICWATKFTKLKVYVGVQQDWYKGVKVVKTDGAITAVYSEWRTDESSLRVRTRQVLYVTDANVVVKGNISGVKDAVTTPVVTP